MAGDNSIGIKQDGRCINRIFLYNCLYFYFENKIIKKNINCQKKEECKFFYLQQISLLQKYINRFLYSNFNALDYEHFILIILNVSCFYCNTIYKVFERKSIYNSNIFYCMNSFSSENVATKIINENNSSDMADSGLETGSIVSTQETISEHSSTDLDELNESVNIKKNSESFNISEESCSAEITFNGQQELLCESKNVSGKITEFGKESLNDLFYEPNEDSDEDSQTNPYIPSVSFGSKINKKNDKKLTKDDITYNGRKPNITIEHSIDLNSSMVSNNYYFIDASSLNDDIDVSTTNVVGYPNDVNGRLAWSNPQLPSSCYIPSSRSNNFFLEDDSFKFANRKTIAQNRYEKVAEFQQDLKVSEYIEPFTEIRKIKKFDSLSAQDDSCTSANKESLVVEIKEVDSGESAQHSPCPDNTKLDDIQKVQNKLSNIDLDEEEKEQQKDTERKPSLIRRNTFELDANDEKLSSLRQEYERRQGELVFQNSITQYSQHRIDGDSYFNGAEPNTMIIDDITDSQFPLTSISDSTVSKYDVDLSEKKSTSGILSNANNKTALISIAKSISDESLANNNVDEDISFKSLPININDELSTNVVNNKTNLKRNEAAPIISGGASTSDYRKPNDSPIVKRRTESTPIVSGGSVISSELQDKVKSKLRSANMSSSMTAWVVDMSDCQSNNDKHLTTKKVKELQTTMSVSYSSSTDPHKEREKEKSQCSSLGYFVNLEDISSPKELSKQSGKHRRRPSDTTSEKNYCEFFIDLSDKSGPSKNIKKSEVAASTLSSSKVTETANAIVQSNSTSQSNDSKKNIFSMFIDLNEPETTVNRVSVTKSNSSSKLADKRLFDLAPKRDFKEQAIIDDKKSKPSVFMFIESDSPIVRRRTLSSSRPAFKRHSWNTDKSNEKSESNDHSISQTEPHQDLKNNENTTPAAVSTIAPSFRRVHKRAHSLSVERVGDFRKLLGHKSSSSSHSLTETIAVTTTTTTTTAISTREVSNLESERTEELFEYEVRDTPPNSHVEIVNEELLVSLKNRNYKELDAINEQANKESTTKPTDQDECCSENSIWEKTPTENTENSQTRKSETFDISSSASGPSSASDNLEFKLSNLFDASQNRSLITANSSKYNTNDKSFKNIDEKTTKANLVKVTTPASFVRLSDLDKRPAPTSNINTNAPIMRNHENSYRLSNSVTETSWIESKLVMSTRINEPFHKTLTKKLPLNVATGQSKSENFEEFGIEGDAEAMISESDLSSLQSSMGRSGQGSAEETETSTSFALGKPYNRLGEDLLRMFLEEINPDVTIDVGGRRIKAHKCILSSRCQYFAAILSGGWVENAGNIISLQGYSYNAVHFALCHIYSGESCIPDTISIVELATLADMLCLEGLKEVIGFTLKVKYCHLFHKPCNGCAVGVLECMPLAAAYGLDEVYRKSLRWVTRHFVRIWPTKEFATLPRELMDKCYHQHIVHMSNDNIMQTIMDSDKLLTSLPNVRWAEPVFRLVSNLLDVSMKYLIDNFSGVLVNESFQGLDRELTWNISRLEDHLLAAAERLPPEQACKTYSKLDKMFSSTLNDDTQHVKAKWNPLFIDLINKIREKVEKCLIRDAARAVRTNAWLKMDLELRRRIQELACLVILPNETATKRPSRHSNFLKEPKERQELKIPMSRTPPNRNSDLRKVKMAISEHSDRTLKQTPLLQTRKVMNKPKTDPLERKLQNEKLTNDTNNVLRPKSWPNKIEVKSRYLEPRNRTIAKDSTQTNQEKVSGQQRRKIMISSSDSSRTSSPAMKRAAEKKSLSKIKIPMKKDGKALSSDSLTESSSRMSLKKDIASKSCGITRPESPSLKAKDIETGLSVDSLADSKKKPLIKKTNKMDTSMSTDSLMTDITAITTPKSMLTNKSSPVLGKATANTSVVNQTRSYEKLKKSSPPTQQRNSLSLMRRPARSLESSTAASRSRAAAIVNTYHGSLNLRKSLLDAAKAPDIPSKTLNNSIMTRSSLRQSGNSVKSSVSSFTKIDKSEKKDEPTTNNQRSNSSPGSKRSPKSNINSRLSKSTIVTNKQKTNKFDDKSSNKLKSQAVNSVDRDGPKFLNQSSRSGTFLKDEPTILNKSDIETAAIDV